MRCIVFMKHLKTELAFDADEGAALAVAGGGEVDVVVVLAFVERCDHGVAAFNTAEMHLVGIGAIGIVKIDNAEIALLAGRGKKVTALNIIVDHAAGGKEQ